MKKKEKAFNYTTISLIFCLNVYQKNIQTEFHPPWIRNQKGIKGDYSTHTRLFNLATFENLKVF